jgi:hypothetical protein
VKEICDLPLKKIAATMKVELIPASIPAGLWYVKDVLKQEVKNSTISAGQAENMVTDLPKSRQ